MGTYDMHPLAVQPTQVLLLVRAALERAVITPGDAAEVLGTSTEEIRQLLSRPRPAEGERRANETLRTPHLPTVRDEHIQSCWSMPPSPAASA